MIKNIFGIVIISLVVQGCSQKENRKADLTIQVDLNKKKGSMTPVWAWFWL